MRQTRPVVGVIVPVVLLSLGTFERLVAQDVTANASPSRQSGRGRGAQAPVISTAAIPQESPLAKQLDKYVEPIHCRRVRRHERGHGTALESNTKLQDSIYFRGADSTTLYVNLFVASALN
jgi:hypothetical protein